MTNHLWQSTVFAIAAGLLTVAFRKNRAAVRYWLWFSTSIKFLVPFALLTMLGGRMEKHVARPILPVVVAPLIQVSAPFADVPSVSPRQNGDWTGAALFGGWLCGFLGVALIRLRGWRRISAAVRSSAPLEIAAPASLQAERAVWEWPGMSMDEFSRTLFPLVQRPVLDKTGLSGRFDLHLEYAPEPGALFPPRPADYDPTGGTSIFTAVQEQLGLKLDSAKGSREILVIDHVERPSEN